MVNSRSKGEKEMIYYFIFGLVMYFLIALVSMILYKKYISGGFTATEDSILYGFLWPISVPMSGLDWFIDKF